MWHTNQGMTMHTPQTASTPSLHIFHPQLNFPTIRWHWLQMCSGHGSHCVPEESDHRLQPDSSYTEHWPELCSVILYAHKQAEITLVSWWHFRFTILVLVCARGTADVVIAGWAFVQKGPWLMVSEILWPRSHQCNWTFCLWWPNQTFYFTVVANRQSTFL